MPTVRNIVFVRLTAKQQKVLEFCDEIRFTDCSGGTNFLSNSDSCVDLLYRFVVYLMVSPYPCFHPYQNGVNKDYNSYTPLKIVIRNYIARNMLTFHC